MKKDKFESYWFTLKKKILEVKKSVRIWLFIGLILIFVQIIIGGITRLTDSGLSITEWEVIKGTIPPLNEDAWQIAFDKYKEHAKKQHESLHGDMTLSSFKKIYFWEWFHRLWAKSMGFIFLFPFLFFVFKKMMPTWLAKRLGIVILLAATVAVFGWIMVASGLNEDNRTWVSAYKLLTHLILASILFGYLFWTWLKASYPQPLVYQVDKLRKFSQIIVAVVLVQISLGALMAGMRAGLIHPYFPMFIKFDNLLAAFNMDGANISEKLINYETGTYMKGFVQIAHRSVAYVLSILILIFYFKCRPYFHHKKIRVTNNLLISMLIIQFILGVLTIINCFGKIPLVYGVLHQAGALILFLISLSCVYFLRKSV